MCFGSICGNGATETGGDSKPANIAGTSGGGSSSGGVTKSTGRKSSAAGTASGDGKNPVRPSEISYGTSGKKPPPARPKFSPGDLVKNTKDNYNATVVDYKKGQKCQVKREDTGDVEGVDPKYLKF